MKCKSLTRDESRSAVCRQHDLQVDYYGKRLATCSSDRIIKIFDVGPEPGQQTLSANIAGHDGPVWQVASFCGYLVTYKADIGNRLRGHTRNSEAFSHPALMTERLA